MLTYYVDLSLSKRVDSTDAYICPWAEEAALKTLIYCSYSNAYQVGLYLYRQGKKEESAQWIQVVQYYYPYMVYFYTDEICSHPAFAPLLPKLLSDCKDFINASKHQTAKSCDRPQTKLTQLSVCPYRPSENVKSDKFLCEKAQKHRKLRYQRKQIAC